MAKSLVMAAVVGAVWLLSFSQAALLPSSSTSGSRPAAKRGDVDLSLLAPRDPFLHEEDNNVVEQSGKKGAGGGDLVDDRRVEEELTEEEKGVGAHVEFPLKEMTEEELKVFLKLEDQIFLAEADEHVAFQLLKEKRGLYTKGGNLLRRKRIAPLITRVALSVGRSLARRFARSGVTRSGTRVTRHYNGRGSYRDAVRDFNRMRPSNVRTFNGRISGQTGTVGRHRVTVRDGSSGNSRPTLEVRSHGGDLVRKFRYNGN